VKNCKTEALNWQSCSPRKARPRSKYLVLQRAIIALGLTCRRGPREIWLWRGTRCLKPSADVDLSVSLAAEVPRPIGVGSLCVPFKNRELGISALNYKPMNRIASLYPTDFTSEFLQSSHRFLMVPQDHFYSLRPRFRFRKTHQPQPGGVWNRAFACASCAESSCSANQLARSAVATS
jgi:hypothetical protein